ncbi:MAG: 5-(carboxyamino)imidazole ribonucleotide synthase, partial [Planctomycetota bacterium]|nr:5-(carboxyamino)imidazole ribonucleotide synthase [Planctomycetota bacterium]
MLDEGSRRGGVLAVVGGGQLGMMIGEAAAGLGVQCRFLDPNPGSPAARVGEMVVGAYDDPVALARLIEGADAATYEFENVPAEAAEWLEAHVATHPPSRALAVCQDRLLEKELFGEVGIGTAPFERVDHEEELRAAVARVGLPCVLKTRRLGYDGRGQCVIRGVEEVGSAWEVVGRAASIVEGYVKFGREVSVIAVRGRDGAMRFWPLTQNRHEAGILRESVAPAPGVDGAMQERAEAMARGVMERLGYVGVMAIELFDCGGGELLGNEMAPRVHNSGHWTIEGSETSQF